MQNGTIKLYRKYGSDPGYHQAEIARYYTISERKRIVEVWKRRHGSLFELMMIQIAPGVDLTNKFKTL